MSQLEDLELFRALNKEYRSRSKRVHTRPPKYNSAALAARGGLRAKKLVDRFDLRGKTVLEIGCGRGEILHAMATQFECRAHGVDITRYEAWDAHAAPGLTFHCCDLGAGIPPELAMPFDFLTSNSVWEHIRHPTTMMARAFELLRPGGTFYLVANLHRGPTASHRYRQVFFPWSHLLFTDRTFERFYESIGKPPNRAAWVNCLSAADYQVLFAETGFEVVEVSYVEKPIDEEIYRRFEEILGRYPRRDLERDFIRAVLRRPA